MSDNKINTGVLFKNNKKESEKHPDYKGEVNVDGQIYELAMWSRTSQNGTDYFSVAIKKPKS